MEFTTNDDCETRNETFTVLEFSEFEHRRSPVWKEFFAINPEKSKDGKLRARCKHCLSTNLIAESRYGTTNVKNHLEKCLAYQRSLSPPEKGKPIFNQNTYRELVAKAIIKHGYPYSWVEHDGNRDIHEYLSGDVQIICRNTAKADCVKLYASLKNNLKNEYRYGELARLARDILSVPLTTVASESTFSIGGRILNKWRSSYIPENVEALITTRSWLYGYQPTEEDFLGSDVEWSAIQASK